LKSKASRAKPQRRQEKQGVGLGLRVYYRFDFLCDFAARRGLWPLRDKLFLVELAILKLDSKFRILVRKLP
jgi:hypothetical protein